MVEQRTEDQELLRELRELLHECAGVFEALVDTRTAPVTGQQMRRKCDDMLGRLKERQSV